LSPAAPAMRLKKKHLLQMLALAGASILLGLVRNFIAAPPLPLFRQMPPAAGAAPLAGFAEADADMVRQFCADPQVALLDARTTENFELGHIPGAVSLPVSRFAEFFPGRLERLRSARMLVVYCSGRTCSDSRELAALLFQKGFKSLFLYRGGMEDWLEKGNAVQK
jgi:rhodanese-related sulfurtransferase